MKNKKTIPVIQANRLIEAKYKLTLQEQRLILIMISKIKATDEDFKEYHIAMTELAQLLEIDKSYIYKEIKNILTQLIGRVLHLRQDDGKYLVCSWICRAIYDKHGVSFSFVPNLKPYLLQIKREFTVSDFCILRNFQSIYSIRIYNLLKQYVTLGQREFDLTELKEILGIEKSYPVWEDFKRRVILQAKSEFENPDNECDINFNFLPIKEGKRIARLKFVIKEKKQEETRKEQAQSLPAQSQPQQPATVHPTHKYFSRLPFDRYDDEFGQWLAEKRLIVDLQQWGESGYNSFICRASYNDFLKDTGRA